MAGRTGGCWVPVAALSCWLGCGDGREPIPAAKHGLPPGLEVRELSDAQQLALCEDSVERMRVASDRQVQCSLEAIGRSLTGPECTELRAACLAREDDSVDEETSASLCARLDEIPGAGCDLTVSEYSRCVGALAAHQRKIGEAASPYLRRRSS